MAHTISNLDLDMRIALGNVLHASNDFRHSRDGKKGLACSLRGRSDGTGAVGSRKSPETGFILDERPNGSTSRVLILGAKGGPV